MGRTDVGAAMTYDYDWLVLGGGAAYWFANQQEAPFTGRVNLFATRAGVLRVDAAAVDRVNAVDEAITVATLPAFAPVVEGEMVATVKIIPYAVPQDALARAVATAGEGALTVASYVRTRVGVISTLLPALKPSVVDKTLRVLEARLAPAGDRGLHALADRGEVLLRLDLERHAHVVVPGLGDEADRVRLGVQQRREAGIVGGRAAGALRHAEGGVGDGFAVAHGIKNTVQLQTSPKSCLSLTVMLLCCPRPEVSKRISSVSFWQATLPLAI